MNQPFGPSVAGFGGHCRSAAALAQRRPVVGGRESSRWTVRN